MSALDSLIVSGCDADPFCIPWLYGTVVCEGNVIKIENLYGLYDLGGRVECLNMLLNGKHTLGEVAILSRQVQQGLRYIIAGKIIPLTAISESAGRLSEQISMMITGKHVADNWQLPLNPAIYEPVRVSIDQFQHALSEELRQLPIFFLKPKGLLSLDALLSGASAGYRPATIALIDPFIKGEIDEAGRCLAFARATACGYHILRSVETAIKGYLHAKTGTLPRMPNRSWSIYVKELENAGASTDLTDVLKILNKKRNPLMHPEDVLEIDEAVGIFNLCNTTIDAVIDDVKTNQLDTAFTASLAVLPTL